MMNSMTEKEKLLLIFSDMNEQLAQLQLILRNSVSDLRGNLIQEEEDKLAISRERMLLFERGYLDKEERINVNYSMAKNPSAGLKLELGF